MCSPLADSRAAPEESGGSVNSSVAKTAEIYCKRSKVAADLDGPSFSIRLGSSNTSLQAGGVGSKCQTGFLQSALLTFASNGEEWVAYPLVHASSENSPQDVGQVAYCNLGRFRKHNLEMVWCASG